MKLIVNPHKIEIEKTPVNEKEINVTNITFEFAEEITNDFVKEAYFTYNGSSYKVIINNNECSIPYEVLNKQGMVEIGVVAYLVEDETEIKRYNPSPVYISTLSGSLKDAENTEPVTPSDKEQIEQLLQDGLNDIEEAIDRASNLDVDAEKVDKTTTITITKQDGTQETTEINDGIDGVDGISLQYNWNGTNLGIKREDEQSYQYVNLKGDKGDAGSIQIIIVNELPSVGDENTIYLMPYEDAEQGNIYKEYIYINGTWEELGSIPVEVDLSDYYTKSEVNALIPDQLSDLQDDSTHRLVTDTEKTTWNNKVGTTDYATSSTGGVIKAQPTYNFNVSAGGSPYAITKTYAEYQNQDTAIFISKGTLENVINGKNLGDMSKSVYDTNNNGIVDNAEKVNNHTVEDNVPSTLNDTLNIVTGESVETSTKGTTISIDNVSKYKDISLFGDTQQEGTPTPDTPQEVKVVTGTQTLSISDGTNTNNYEVNLGTLELCKIGDYQDFIKKSNGKNLFDGLTTKGSYNTTTGEVETTIYDMWRNTNSIKTNPNQSYVFSLNSTALSVSIRLLYYDKNHTFLSTESTSNGKFTTPSNCYYVNWHSTALYTNYPNGLVNAMIEEGSTATEYEPYGKVWYKKANIGKLDMSTITDWSGNGAGKYYVLNLPNNYGISRNNLLSNIFNYDTTAWSGAGKFGITTSNNLWIDTGDTTLISTDDVPNWLLNKNAIMYGILVTPKYEIITDTNLINQLENIELFTGSNSINVIGNLPAPSQIKVFTNTLDGKYEYLDEKKANKADIPDTTAYVKNTDYATSSVGGVLRTGNQLTNSNGVPFVNTLEYSNYENATNGTFIGKGTLENVITGKGLVSNTDYATSSTAGVVKPNIGFEVSGSTGQARTTIYTYNQYNDLSNYGFIGKGTLENVIAGKALFGNIYSTTKTPIGIWVNGKPIYRKVINNISITSTPFYVDTNENIDEIINFYAIGWNNTNTEAFKVGHPTFSTQAASNYGRTIVYEKTNNRFALKQGGAVAYPSSSIIIFEFTETD